MTFIFDMYIHHIVTTSNQRDSINFNSNFDVFQNIFKRNVKMNIYTEMSEILADYKHFLLQLVRDKTLILSVKVIIKTLILSIIVLYLYYLEFYLDQSSLFTLQLHYMALVLNCINLNF